MERLDSMEGELKKLRKQVEWAPNATATRLYPVLQLDKLSDTLLPNSFFGGWALQADNLLEVVLTIIHKKPKLVVELGSGQSTLWLARALDYVGSGRLVSLDHNEDYGKATQQRIARHELEHIADVRVAPLADVEIEGETYPWYNRAALTGIKNIDVLMIDGPPAPTHPQARYPALPLLQRLLSDGCDIFLDDAERSREKRTVQSWVEQYSATLLSESAGAHGPKAMAHLRYDGI